VVRKAQNIDLYRDLQTTSAILADHQWSAEQTLGITAVNFINILRTNFFVLTAFLQLFSSYVYVEKADDFGIFNHLQKSFRATLVMMASLMWPMKCRLRLFLFCWSFSLIVNHVYFNEHSRTNIGLVVTSFELHHLDMLVMKKVK